MDLLKGLVGDPAKIGEGLTSYGSDLKTSIGTEGDWDVVMVLPVTPSDEESKEEDVENANRKFFEATIEKLASAGLQYKSYYSIQGDEIYVKIRSPEDRLEGQADVRDVPMLMDPSKLEKALAAGFPELQIAPIDIGTDCDGQSVSRFAPSQHIYCKYDRHPSLLPLYSHPANATSPFRSMQRIKLVTDIIQTLHRFGGCEISVGKEINDGKMLAFMCLHDPIERTALYQKWMTYPWAAPVSQMPFDEYKDYFGEQAALYMASLGHATTYTAWLGALGLVATTIIQVIGFDSKPAAYDPEEIHTFLSQASASTSPSSRRARPRTRPRRATRRSSARSRARRSRRGTAPRPTSSSSAPSRGPRRSSRWRTTRTCRWRWGPSTWARDPASSTCPTRSTGPGATTAPTPSAVMSNPGPLGARPWPPATTGRPSRSRSASLVSTTPSASRRWRPRRSSRTCRRSSRRGGASTATTTTATPGAACSRSCRRSASGRPRRASIPTTRRTSSPWATAATSTTSASSTCSSGGSTASSSSTLARTRSRPRTPGTPTR